MWDTCVALTGVSRKEGLLNLRTNKYKLHFYETATGLKFVMNTDINEAASAPNVTALLHEIYQSVSVTCILLRSFYYVWLTLPKWDILRIYFTYLNREHPGRKTVPQCYLYSKCFLGLNVKNVKNVALRRARYRLWFSLWLKHQNIHLLILCTFVYKLW